MAWWSICHSAHGQIHLPGQAWIMVWFILHKSRWIEMKPRSLGYFEVIVILQNLSREKQLDSKVFVYWLCVGIGHGWAMKSRIFKRKLYLLSKNMPEGIQNTYKRLTGISMQSYSTIVLWMVWGCILPSDSGVRYNCSGKINDILTHKVKYKVTSAVETKRLLQ